MTNGERPLRERPPIKAGSSPVQLRPAHVVIGSATRAYRQGAPLVHGPPALRRPGDSLSTQRGRAHNGSMERPGFQLSVAGLLGVVACIAFNIWLFRLGALWGIIGLNV